MRKQIILLTATALGLTSTGCSESFKVSQSSLAEKIDETLGCQNFEESIWDSLNQHVEKTGRPPSVREFDTALKNVMRRGRSGQAHQRLQKVDVMAQQNISQEASELLETVLLSLPIAAQSQVDEDTGPSLRSLWQERLAELELGDRTTPEKSKALDDVQRHFEKLKILAASSGLDASTCATPPPAATPPPTQPQPPPPPETSSSLYERWQKTFPSAVYGGLKVLGTSYQSCEAGVRAPLMRSSPSLGGISIVGTHPSGTGKKRVISNIKEFLSDHPYLDPYKQPLPTCHDILKAPLIYDYGGKPYTTTADDKFMDLFRDAGSGTKELGIDCSAFVFSAYATVGLKFKAETSLKARLVSGVSSTMLTDPKKNGLSCLEHAPFGKSASLKPGDIIAIKGHVVMVEHVGADPFGIAKISSADGCTASQMSISRFNFNLLQSAPEKGGIGINRIEAKEYLSSFSTMGRGLIEHAVNACKARFQGNIESRSSLVSVVRHIGTQACADQPVRLAKEECLSSCPYRDQDTN
ncbi:MAG: hypothetical protein IPJ84_18495 [Bdellovibrionales bacterium]|nr:hypothetical protein [Bdellovibrionales bacterium]